MDVRLRVADEAVRGGRPRPLGQGPGAQGPGAAGRALLVTLDVCGIDRPTVESDPRRVATAPRPRTRPHRAGLLAHPLRARRRHQPADDVQDRRRRAPPDRRLHEMARGCHREGRPERRWRHLADAQLAWANGRCDFAVNRRANKEKDVPRLRRTARPARTRRPRRPGPPRLPTRRLPAVGRLRLRLPLHGAQLLQVLRRLRGLRPGRARDRDIPARRPCSSPAAAPIRIRSLAGRSSWPNATASSSPTSVADGPGRPHAARSTGPLDGRTRRSRWPSPRCPTREQIENDTPRRQLLHRQPRQAPARRSSTRAASSSRRIPIRSRSGSSTT